MGRKQSRRQGRDLNGILLFDKPPGISSNDALQKVRRLYKARKAGHTGNLDLQATGLLPLCFGEATKLCAFLLAADKYYGSEVELGTATTTGDSEGEVTYKGSVDGIDIQGIETAMGEFAGEIEQLPPMHSAIKFKGQPLYKLARKGIEVERQPRRVRIYLFRLRYLQDDCLGVDVHCSKGTYIRTLAEDLGKILGCGAHVASLKRIRVGPYDVDDACSIDVLEEKAHQAEHALDALLLPMDSALSTKPQISLTEDASFYLQRGQPVLVARAPTSGLVRLYAPGQRFIGVGEVQDDGRIAPRRLLRAAQKN